MSLAITGDENVTLLMSAPVETLGPIALVDRKGAAGCRSAALYRNANWADAIGQPTIKEQLVCQIGKCRRQRCLAIPERLRPTKQGRTTHHFV
jgi:hypothetical protein